MKKTKVFVVMLMAIGLAVALPGCECSDTCSPKDPFCTPCDGEYDAAPQWPETEEEAEEESVGFCPAA